MRALYTAFLHLLIPVVLLRLWWRGRRNRAYRQRWTERFGAVPTRPPGGVWVHAVSVGEVLAALPVIDAWRAQDPSLVVTITTATATGAERVAAHYRDADPQGIQHLYAPYDLPWVLKRFLARVQPRLCLVMETELWPNLVAGCVDARVPVWLLNARLSKKSARGYARFGALTRPMLKSLSGVCAQHHSDARRLHRLGVPTARLHITGSVKSDVLIDAQKRDSAKQLRAQLGADRPVWIAASTHEGEERYVLQAFQQWRQQQADAALILVPRHPERFDAVAALVADMQFECVRRSQAAPTATTAVYLADSMGELLMLYCAADVAFVGGSLVPVGGHNLLEPAAVPMAMLQGPYTHNFHALSRQFRRASAALTVQTPEQLAEVIQQAYAQRAALSVKAAAELESLRGSLSRVLALLKP